MNLLIGVDDTDNLESRGTGYCARQLANWLADNHLAVTNGITRHQLLVDPRIPYTSHNSSACLLVEAPLVLSVWDACCEFLLRESAQGADVGLCIAQRDSIPDLVASFGQRAKREVLTMSEAEQIASEARIKLAGLTGSGGGVIGALAGVGLRRTGNDGRFLWLPGLRELSGKAPVAQVCSQGHIDRVCTLDGFDLASDTLVDLGDWVRPVLRGGQATLFVEGHGQEWRSVPKEHVKNLSN